MTESKKERGWWETDDRVQEREKRIYRSIGATETAEKCGKCGSSFSPDDQIYRHTPAGRSWWENLRVPLCEECAPSWMVAGTLVSYTRYEIPTTRECDGCGRSVVFVLHRNNRGVVRERKRVFCSSRCEQADRERRREQAQRGEPRTHNITCEGCGTEFVAKRSDAKTCSSKCRQRAYRQRLRV